MKALSVATFFLIITLSLPVAAAQLFAGYAKIPWGTDAHKIVQVFPKGEMLRMGDQDVYKQKAPNRQMKQRSFAFRDGKLAAVSVTFNPVYVKKTGIEKLLAAHKKAYGEGIVDNSGAPHMVSYKWEDARTKITFAYAPQRADMTILLFEKK